MALNRPSRQTTTTRPDRLSRVTTTADRRPELWKDSKREFDGFAKLLNHLAEKTDTDRAVNICLFVECIADHFARGFTTIRDGETTLDLARGHKELNQLVSPTTLECAEALEVIRLPTVYAGSRKRTREQIARRRLWDLGSTAKEFIDMEAVRGYDEETATLRSDLNEGIAHRHILRLAKLTYAGRGKRVKTYVKADSIADVPDELSAKVYDLVAYNQGSVYATCEVEMQPTDRAHITDDARLHAMLPGDSDWIVYRKQDVNRLLHTFVRDGSITLPDGHPGWGNALDLSTTFAMERLQRVVESPEGSIPSLESSIVTSVNTADNLREMAQAASPKIFQELDF